MTSVIIIDKAVLNALQFIILVSICRLYICIIFLYIFLAQTFIFQFLNRNSDSNKGISNSRCQMSISNLNLITKLSEYLLIASYLIMVKLRIIKNIRQKAGSLTMLLRNYNSIFNNYTVNFQLTLQYILKYAIRERIYIKHRCLCACVYIIRCQCVQLGRFPYEIIH